MLSYGGELIWKLWKEFIWEQAEKSKEDMSCERGTKPELGVIDRSIVPSMWIVVSWDKGEFILWVI